MKANYLIKVDEFCVSHGIEMSFISSLEESGMVHITKLKETGFITSDQLQQLEKFIRFYNDLDINLEGIETVHHLLQKISLMQDEIISLKNRLRLYEAAFSDE